MLDHCSEPLRWRPELSEHLAQGHRELLALFGANTHRDLAEGETLIERGQPSPSIYRLYKGWAARTRSLSHGRRAIVDVYLPGDLIGIDAGLQHRAPDEVAMLTRGSMQVLPAGALMDLLARPHVALYLHWQAVEAQSRIERMATALCRWKRRSGSRWR